ncbi:MAG TPA: hypothetical protein VMV69_08445 [Pirellulales bacterium]|nr:hypothetical protein [Pirellulales bacterium]
MKKHPFAFLLAAACLAALLVWIAESRSVAQCGSSTPDPEDEQADIPQQVSGAFLTGSSRALPPAPAPTLDPGFGPQIDENLARAVHEGDAGLLTDTALQLAEGHRVLLRPHKELPTTGVMRMACRLGAERGDAASLDRLAKAAQTCGDKQLGDDIRAAQKTASAARSPQPTLLASVLDTPAETFALYRACLQDIRAARLPDRKRGHSDLSPLCPLGHWAPRRPFGFLSAYHALGDDLAPPRPVSSLPESPLAHLIYLSYRTGRSAWNGRRWMDVCFYPFTIFALSPAARHRSTSRR